MNSWGCLSLLLYLLVARPYYAFFHVLLLLSYFSISISHRAHVRVWAGTRQPQFSSEHGNEAAALFRLVHGHHA